MIKISKEAELELLRYAWKGNVRELENVIERAVLVGSGTTLTCDHLFLDQNIAKQGKGVTIRAGLSVREMEENLISMTLKEVNGNRTYAAEMLGISIRTLRNKLNEYKTKAVYSDVSLLGT